MVIPRSSLASGVGREGHVQLRELLWDARWDAVVMFSNAVVTNVGIHWWLAPLLIFIGAAASSRV